MKEIIQEFALKATACEQKLARSKDIMMKQKSKLDEL